MVKSNRNSEQPFNDDNFEHRFDIVHIPPNSLNFKYLPWLTKEIAQY
jgi:hypothetical protein